MITREAWYREADAYQYPREMVDPVPRHLRGITLLNFDAFPETLQRWVKVIYTALKFNGNPEALARSLLDESAHFMKLWHEWKSLQGDVQEDRGNHRKIHLLEREMEGLYNKMWSRYRWALDKMEKTVDRNSPEYMEYLRGRENSKKRLENMTIHKESWHKEADSLEADLARLKKLLFQGAISELEFANAVIRLHGTTSTLEKQADGTFRVTTEWRNAHKEEVEKVEALANEILIILQAQGLDLETFAQEVGAFGVEYLSILDPNQDAGEELYVVSDSGEGEVEATPLQRHLYSTWGWVDSPTYELAREYMYDISTKWFRMGAPALVIPGEVGFPFAETAGQSAQSESDFNEYLLHLSRALEAALTHIRQGM